MSHASESNEGPSAAPIRGGSGVHARAGSMPAVHDAALDETTVGDVMTRDVAVAGATDTLAFAAQASDVMRRHLLTVRPTCTLESAIAKLLDANLRHLVVVDDEFRLLGIVSDRDIRAAVGEPVRSLAMGGGARGEVGERRVETIMTRNPITVGPEASVTDVAEIFVDERIGAVPVVRKDDTVLGMISYVDVIAHFVGRRR